MSFSTRVVPVVLLFGLSTGLLTCGPRPTETARPGAHAPRGFPRPVDSAKKLGGAAELARWQPKKAPPPPLKVIHKSPTKLAEGLSAITVTFNQPMVRLGRARSKAEDPKRFPIRIEPPVKAVYRWVAGDTLKVALKKPLQNATRYRVTLEAGLRSFSGARLPKPYSWAFESPRPEVVRWRLLPKKAVRGGRLLPKDRFLLTFNLKMDPADVGRKLSIKANGRNHTASVTRYRKDPKKVVVRPASPFPPGAAVTLKVDTKTHTVEGPLVSRRVFLKKFKVYGPLKVRVHCDEHKVGLDYRCWPMQNRQYEGLEIRFSELVRRDQVLKHVKIVPPPRNLKKNLVPLSNWCRRRSAKGPCSHRWRLKEDLRPRSGYRVRINAGIRDYFGQRLGTTEDARFKTKGYPPGIFLPGDKEGFREKWQTFRFKAMNVRRARVEFKSHTGADLIRFVTCLRKKGEGWKEQCVKGPPTLTRTVTFGATRDVIQTRSVSLPGGLVAVKVTSPQVKLSGGKPVVFRTLVTQTNLGLHARLSPFGVSAWVTALRTGRPVRNVEISISDHKGNKLWTGLTNRQGFAEALRVQLGKILRGKHGPRLYVLARKGTDTAYLTLADPSRPDLRRHRWYWERPRWYRGTWSAFSGDDDDEESTSPLGHQSLDDYRAWEGDRPMLAGYISTERGIYRPGQTVYLHGAARVFRAWRGAPAAGVEAVVKIKSPTRVVITRQVLKLGPMGVFKLSINLPRAGKLGYHHAELWVKKKKIAHHYFRVAEYRAPRFRVRLTAHPKPPQHVLPDGIMIVNFWARYLFGGALDGAAYRVSVTRSPTYHYVTGHSGYKVGNASWYFRQKPRVWRRLTGTLDRKGRARLTFRLKDQGKHFPWPAYQYVEAEVTSAAYRSVAARRYVEQHPGEVYAAFKGLPSKGLTLRRHIKVFSPKPKEWVPRGGFTVTATLFAAKDYHPDWSKKLWKKSFPVPTTGHELKVKWPKAYLKSSAILLLSVTDSAGREARTAEHVNRPTQYSRASEKDDVDQKKRKSQLRIKLDKDEYLPGQYAKVTVTRKGPAGDAVLFLERERIFQTHRLKFDRTGKTTLRIKVEDRFARTVTLRAVALRAGKALRGRLGPLVTASKDLRVSRKPYHLKVKLKTDRKTYRPGQRVKVKLQVKDGLKRTRRSQVVLMAVDEAVLQLTGYSLPDPIYSLLRTPSMGVLADDLRHHLAPLKISVVHINFESALGSLMGHSVGGAGGGGGFGLGGLAGSKSSKKRKQQRSRKKFLTCPWHATVVTDEQGRAETSFTLPDNLTEYRIMAFAVDDSRSAGTGHTSLKVDLPLLAMPAFPRFVREGDKFRGGVILYNKSLPEGRAVVTASLTGTAVRADGKLSRAINLRKGKEGIVRFGFIARRPGTAKLTFSVRMGTVTDRFDHVLEVQRPTFSEAASVSGQIRGAVRQSIERLSGLRSDHGGLEVSLSSTALVGVEDGMDQLIKYPYGCLEQKASRLLPMIAAAVLGKRFRLKLPGKPKKLIRIGMQDILAMQRSDGGFGYWPRSRMSWAWATAYALIVMHRAKMAQKATGLTLPIDAVGRALRYLRPFARKPKQLGFYWFPYHTFILYALSLHGEDVTKDALLASAVRHREPLFARAMLLAAMANIRRKKPSIKKAIKTLAAEISDSLRIDGTWAHAEENLHDGYKVMMHSDDRSTAMVLLSLLHARPRHPMIPRLVRWFLLGRKQARFRNTQEAAWALMALWDYARIREKVVPDFEAGVWLGRKRIVKTFFRGRSLRPHLTALKMSHLMRVAGRAAQDLIIAKRGKGTLYYVARLRYARLRLPERPRDHGMQVTKLVQVLSKAGRPLKRQRTARLGDIVMVTLKVKTNEARRYVVIDDPLPAGMEALDATLAIGSRTFGAADAWRKSSRWNHRELRDDRVLFFRDYKQPGTLTYRYLARVTSPGVFLVPPTKAEEMYTPEVFGHTATFRMAFKSK